MRKHGSDSRERSDFADSVDNTQLTPAPCNALEREEWYRSLSDELLVDALLACRDARRVRLAFHARASSTEDARTRVESLHALERATEEVMLVERVASEKRIAPPVRATAIMVSTPVKKGWLVSLPMLVRDELRLRIGDRVGFIVGDHLVGVVRATSE